MTKLVSVSALTSQVTNIFLRAGVVEPQAKALAKTYVAAERDGCKSHGIYRIEGSLITIKSGKVDPKAVPTLHVDESAIVRVDANGGFAAWGFELAIGPLAQKAQTMGLAALVLNNMMHNYALWPDVEALADLGLASLSMNPSYATVAPFGGSKPLLGTNPFAFGWPRKGKPHYAFDFATSVAARGEIELLRLAGKSIPENWALDAEGQPTTDPTAALKGAMLTFGGHKGSAISTMIELLAGVMIGDNTSYAAMTEVGTSALVPHHGQLILALSPERFSAGRPGSFFDTAETLFSAIESQGARIPASRRHTNRTKSEAEGIALTDKEAQSLERFENLGLDAVP